MGALAGYKTYIVGTLAVLGAIAGYLTGEESAQQTAQVVITAIMGMTVRHGVSTEIKKAAQ